MKYLKYNKAMTPQSIAAAITAHRSIRTQPRNGHDHAVPSSPIRPWVAGMGHKPKPVKKWTDVECIAYLVFTCETLAHLQGRERDLLPVTDRVRGWLDGLEEQADLRELGSAVIDGRVSLDAALERAYRLGRDEQRQEEIDMGDQNG